MKKKSKSQLVKELDKIFSEYIRLRDRNICITCGCIGEHKIMQAGHYVSRSCYALRWDERNVHCQCYSCNICKSGNLITYREKLVLIYGEKEVKKLEQQRHTVIKYTQSDIIGLIELYKQKIKELDNSL